MRTMKRELRENGVYRLDERQFIAVAGDDGYILYTPDEWENTSTADYEVDDQGMITFQGTRVGITADVLEDTGETR
jgi:hypothetical protein